MFLPPLPHKSNRLRVLINDSQGVFQHYIYDASGERVLKANSNYTALYENGSLLSKSTTTLNKYTIYPSPFVVLNSEDVLSKHYYVGTQRVASRLRNDIRFDCSNCSTTKKSNSNLKSTEDNSLKQAQIDDLQIYMDLAGKGKVNFAEAPQTEIAETTATSRQAQTTTAGIEGLYYYHPDHLGTSTFLTDQNGVAYQFFLNLPFGETMAEQKGSGYYQNAYKFNGKEQDEETGLYYYGARYYNPKTSIWLSVDPLAESDEFINDPESTGGGVYNSFNRNPYIYCEQTPVVLTDPDGKCPSCIWGAAIGAAVEYGSQVAVNLAKGQSLKSSLTNVDGGKIAIATVTGALTGGLSSLKVIGATAKVYKAVAMSATVGMGEIVQQGYENGTNKPINAKKLAVEIVADKAVPALIKVAGKVGEKISSTVAKTAISSNTAKKEAANQIKKEVVNAAATQVIKEPIKNKVE